ncbi:G patch domain-containing protein 3 [Paragonimus westermani]|uniref:G patch domain-containing protein 3 n=1 Tax=Paragonimus westermani TaxID=34504 RepID=A0A8T0DL11_9TREM|nr:G patch domain-containing protein 3 [Paragonimus westermani]
MDISDRNLSYIYLCGIPRSYRACHLRNFFSQYVESSSFLCFHFRHRPGLHVSTVDQSVASRDLISCLRLKNRDKSQFCGFLIISAQAVPDFLKRYDRTHWLSVDDNDNETPLSEQCSLYQISFDQRQVELKELLRLIEFKPPSWMPQGNVGTCTAHFFTLIKNCQLDCSIISKLKLNFSVAGRRRLYGAVPYAYDTNPSHELCADACAMLPGAPRSRGGANILNSDEYAEFLESKKVVVEPSLSKLTTSNNASDADDDRTEDEEGEEEPDEPVEEWERFEALHDDPYKLERGDKCSLKYEDKIELVWEKGGPGLVFHTDERTWRKLDPLRKEELFDEPASFDWDVDMEPYETPTDLSVGPTPTGHWGSARDGTDLIHIQRVNENIDLPPTTACDSDAIYRRETSGKGYGLSIMKRMGWRPGMRLGSTRSRGLLSPIDIDGSLPPRVRTGLGFYGPRHPAYSVLRSKPSRTVYIRSVFDSPAYVAARSGLGVSPSLLRRDDSSRIMKYRSPLLTQTDFEAPVSNDNVSMVSRNHTVILTPHASFSKEGIEFVSGGLLHPPYSKNSAAVSYKC